MTKIIFFVLTCATCNLTEITLAKNPYVDCFEYGNYIMSHLEYKHETDDIKGGHYNDEGHLVLGYRCE